MADFTSFCVFRFAADDSRGRVVAGEDGKQLMDVDYLKDIVRKGEAWLVGGGGGAAAHRFVGYRPATGLSGRGRLPVEKPHRRRLEPEPGQELES